MDEGVTIIDRLRNGEQIVCPKCNDAIIIPVGTTADKAHDFICSKCDFEAHWTPALDID